MSGAARINSDNPVYLASSSDTFAILTIGGNFTGAEEPVTSLEFGTGLMIYSASNSSYGGTSPSFTADKPGVDTIIRVYDGTGNYTVRYNEQ
jgi:hypothetical protein